MKRLSRRKVVMIGTSLDAPGGMTSVAQVYREAGFFREWNVCYLSSFERPGLRTQVSVMAKALFTMLLLFLRREVGLLHVHSASRGSFWRKSIFCALARAFGVPYVFHIHSGEFPVFFGQECGPLRQAWIRHTLRRAQGVIALTASWRDELNVLVPGAKIVVLGNPVVLPKKIAADRGASKNVLFLGRLREKKGVFDLVAAMPHVLEKVPDATFTLAGDGDLAGVAAKARDLGVDHALLLPGWVDGAKKDELLASAAVLVLPSYFEAFPVCILEAMAAGVPVVATTVGGIPEVLEGGTCGLLVPPGDVQALASALISTLGEPECRENLRKRAFVRARNSYSVHTILSGLGNLYGRAIVCGANK